MSLVTLHPGAKRHSSIQTGLVVSASHWLQRRPVKKRLSTGVKAVVLGVGTPALLELTENLTHPLPLLKKSEQRSGGRERVSSEAGCLPPLQLYPANSRV